MSSFGETLAPLLVAPRLRLEGWLWCAGTPGLRKPNLEEFGDCCCLKLLGGDMYTYMCFVYPLNSLGSICTELASVVGHLRKEGLSAGMRGKLSLKIFNI